MRQTFSTNEKKQKRMQSIDCKIDARGYFQDELDAFHSEC
jgi:hypothetical protein